MDFEIALEGPLIAVSRVYHEIQALSPELKRLPPRQPGEEERGRVRILEKDENRVNDKLLYLAQVIERAEHALGLKEGFHLGARNLAYSEPSAGEGLFHKPFQPIPSLTIQPWDPSETGPLGPRTIVLDPHHAFGTGRHPTTRLCLRYLDQQAEATGLTGLEVLDFGCGTGLLALAAVKLGARKALGVEIDAPSVRAAARNVALNELSGCIEIRQGSWEAVEGQFDLVLANLVVSVLLRTGEHISGHLKDQGRAVVSGFGEHQARDMRRFFLDQGLVASLELTLDGWGAFVLVKGSRKPFP